MEMTSLTWRKSTYSSATSPNCVEIGVSVGRVLVRDTKDVGTGPVLELPAQVWGMFADVLK